MKIDRVHIEHYKSLSNVTVEMHPRVTVLVGPNGSGKSNFVDALKFMRDLGVSSSADVIDARRGMSRLIEQGYEGDDAVCEVEQGSKKIHFHIHREKGFAQHTRTGELKTATRGWKFPHTSPDVIKFFKPEQSSDQLREDVSNWATVLHKDAAPFLRAIEALRVVLPNFTSLNITPAGNSYLLPSFQFVDSDGVEKSFDAAQLSDGTLHIFGLLLTLYQSPAPEVIVIEEPEHYVHPAMLALLAECIQELSEITQIILTTHSPHLVGLFKAENIRAVQSINGKTHIAPIKNSQLAAIQNGWIGLEEFMSAEGLYPELHDD